VLCDADSAAVCVSARSGSACEAAAPASLCFSPLPPFLFPRAGIALLAALPATQRCTELSQQVALALLASLLADAGHSAAKTVCLCPSGHWPPPRSGPHLQPLLPVSVVMAAQMVSPDMP
jgi:hypothetical protein